MKKVKLFEQFKNEARVDESVKDGVVTCDKCGWHWDLAQGGDDPHTCHKCGNDAVILGAFTNKAKVPIVNESKYSSSDLKKLKAFAKEVADDIADTYSDYRSFDPDYYDENSMLNWILDWGTDNKLSADQIIKQFDWMSMSDELELNFRY